MSSFGVPCNKGMGVAEEYDEEGLHQSYPKLSGFCCSCMAPVAVGHEISVFGSNTEHGSANYDGSGAKTTPVETLRAEAGVCSYKTVSNRLCVRAHDKAARLPADHPKNLALCGSNQHHLHRSNWREEATRLLDTFPSELRDRKPLCLLQTSSWISHAVSWLVFTDIQGSGRAADHEALKIEILKCIESYKPAFTLYTDGSVSIGTMNGGAAMVITSGSAHCHTVLDT